jgi:putative hydrolase of the HAD superfamily
MVLWDQLGLREHFKAMHYSAELGAVRSEAAFYTPSRHAQASAPAAHCLIDDRPENVQAARHAGWQAVLWTPSSKLSDILVRLKR